MKRFFLALWFSTLFIALSAQDVEQNKSVMRTVMADSDSYSYASASHDTLEVAIKNAVTLLASQIVTDVKVHGKTETHSIAGKDDVEECQFYDQIAETFTNVRLKGYNTLVIAKPDKRNSEYTAFVYIEKETIAQIYAELEAEENKARAEKAKMLDTDVNYYYNEGSKAVKDVRIGDALKYWYWAYALSVGSSVTIGNEPATRFLETKIDHVLNHLQVTAVSCEKVKINKLQEKYNVILALNKCRCKFV